MESELAGIGGLGKEIVSKVEEQEIRKEVKFPKTEATTKKEGYHAMVLALSQSQKENKHGALCLESTLDLQINCLYQFLIDQVLILEKSKKRPSDRFYADFVKEHTEHMKKSKERKRSYEGIGGDVLNNNGLKKQKDEEMEVMETNATKLVEAVIYPHQQL